MQCARLLPAPTQGQIRPMSCRVQLGKQRAERQIAASYRAKVGRPISW